MSDLALAIETYLMDHIGEKIEQMEEALLELPQVEIPVESLFINGMYARKILIPKDTILTGRVHLEDYVDIMLSGDITVATPEGAKRFIGFNIFEGKKGRKRAGYAHEDTHWVTVHRTEIKNPEEFVGAMTVFNMKNYSEMLESREDYHLFVNEMGMSAEQVDEQVKNSSDYSDTSEYSEIFELKRSSIHGIGFFSKKNYEPNEIIMPARIGEIRTEAGRYVNHSISPNAVMLQSGQNIDLVACRKISAGEEVLTSYRDTVNRLRGALCQ